VFDIWTIFSITLYAGVACCLNLVCCVACCRDLSHSSVILKNAWSSVCLDMSTYVLSSGAATVMHSVISCFSSASWVILLAYLVSLSAACLRGIWVRLPQSAEKNSSAAAPKVMAVHPMRAALMSSYVAVASCSNSITVCF